MKQFLLMFLLHGLILTKGVGQGSIELEDKPFSHDQPRITAIDKFLNDTRTYKNYSEEEKEVFYWVNVLRADPAGFLENYLRPFLNEFPDAKGASANSLIQDLKKQKQLPLLAPSSNLSRAAKFLAKDLANRQKGISHISSDGKSFKQRMAEVGVTNCAGENVLEGRSDALKAVILLLIDEGVPDKGHRKALLNPVFTYMGCSFQEKKNGEGYILVQDFSCE